MPLEYRAVFTGSARSMQERTWRALDAFVVAMEMVDVEGGRVVGDEQRARWVTVMW